MSIRSQLSALIQLAKIDGDFDGQEKLHILMVGRANGLSEQEIKEIVENPIDLPDINTMTEDEKFEYRKKAKGERLKVQGQGLKVKAQS